jgi:hypothetical protein
VALRRRRHADPQLRMLDGPYGPLRVRSPGFLTNLVWTVIRVVIPDLNLGPTR